MLLLALWALIPFIIASPLAQQNVKRDVISFKSTGNPILADGSRYSADPGPLVVNDTLYIISGQDTAAVDENSFIINDWQLFVSKTPNPKGGDWELYPDFLEPNKLFSWAAEGTAYAAQIVEGKNGKFYLYAPVTQANTNNSDPFSIGVAVANSPLGPYKDAHPSGPIISQSTPAPGDSIQNIDPTVLVDDDGRVYIYFGTFGALLAYELDSDMVTPISDVIEVDTLTGFFEAPWIMKRNGVYYLLYAANNAGSDSPCTPTSYHACIAYGSSSSPLGPWTFEGVILGIVSSTTSHSGAVQVGDEWFLIYHTADAVGGNHFRRSIAFDTLTWNDNQSPPKINTVVQTHRPQPAPAPTRNVAPEADVESLNETPIQYWVESLHDEIIRTNPLPPDYWASYDGNNSPKINTLVYTWNCSVELNGTSMVFFADQDAGSNVGVAPPASWHVEYLDENDKWVPVKNTTMYPLEATDTPKEVSFHTVETDSLRAILIASGSGTQFAGVAVKEWTALATEAI